jgi:hypothetical protein
MPACFAWMIVSFLLAAPTPAAKWLVVAASSKQIPPTLVALKTLKPSWPDATVVASKDCPNLAPDLYLTVASIQPDRAAAQSTVAQLRSQVPDAYVRACTVRPESRLQLGIPLLDPSIEKVPDDVVNWTDADRISQIDTLPGGGHLWIRREYVAEPDDPNEGRRTAVLFFDQSPSDAHQLESDCPNVSYAAQANLIAITCAREVAADNLFHTVDVFQRPGLEKIASAEHCRGPQLTGTAPACQEEHIGPDGKLSLSPKQLHIELHVDGKS